MSHRGSAAALLTVFAVVALAPAPATSQTETPASAPPGRTPWGDPDLQGFFTTQTFTPLQRPDHLAGKELFTEEEAAELQQLFTADGVDPLAGRAINLEDSDAIRQRLRQTQESIHYDNAVWLRTTQPKGLTSRRTSLIVDPPDGRIPPLTPEAQQRADDRAQARRGHEFDSYETRPLQERCVVWTHEGPPMVPPPYNDVLQIFQVPGYVVILPELSTNKARLIPLNPSPHISPTIRQFRGNSRGRWEGETLVVETTNFTDKTGFQGSSEALHVVERFTRVDADTIRYEFTVDDPATWTSPWSAEIPMVKTDGPLYEYACHEGNHDIRYILEVYRNLDKQAAADASPQGSK